jgi:hypothetical protein
VNHESREHSALRNHLSGYGIVPDNVQRAIIKSAQLRSFPVGSHDDCPDALEMALRVIGELG